MLSKPRPAQPCHRLVSLTGRRASLDYPQSSIAFSDGSLCHASNEFTAYQKDHMGVLSKRALHLLKIIRSRCHRPLCQARLSRSIPRRFHQFHLIHPPTTNRAMFLSLQPLKAPESPIHDPCLKPRFPVNFMPSVLVLLSTKSYTSSSTRRVFPIQTASYVGFPHKCRRVASTFSNLTNL